MTLKSQARLRPIIFLLLAASLLLVGCGTQLTRANWPGLATDGEHLFVAYGPGVLAFDASGENTTPLWQFPEEANASLLFYAEPSVEDGRLIIGDYGAAQGTFSPGVIVTLYALGNLTSNSPSILWQDDGISGDSIIAPAVQSESDNTVYIGTADNKVMAISGENGAVQWEFPVGHSVWGQPTLADDRLIVTSLDKSVYAIDVATGDQLWQTTLSGALPSKPVVANELVYVSSFDSQLHVLDLQSGEEVWTVEATDWVWGAPTVADGVVYFGDVGGGLFAVDAENGEPLWQANADGAIQSSPLVHQGMVYVASEGDIETGQGLLLAFSSEDGSEVWRNTVDLPLYTTPVVAQDTVVVAFPTNEELLLEGYSLETGGRQWSIAPPAQ